MHLWFKFIIVSWAYFSIIHWVYKRFIEQRVNSNIKRFFIIIGMIVLFFSESIVTHIVAYYYAYTIPIPSVSQDELKKHNSNRLKIESGELFGGFILADLFYLSNNKEIISLERMVIRKFDYILLSPADNYGIGKKGVLRKIIF